MRASMSGPEPAEIAAAMPPAFATTLREALAVEREDGSPREDALRRHYFEIMPALRRAQLDPTLEPQGPLFHARLEPRRLPRLVAGLDRLYRLLARAGVPAERALPAPTPAELLERFPTLAALYPETYYGGFMPLLYGYPSDLASFARSGTPLEAIDRHLAAPLIHELVHFSRRRQAILPLYLDECIAGHLGVLVLPELAYPAPGEDNALYAAPWLAQVGQALARVARGGLDGLVRAHAGVVPWEEVFSAGLLEGARRLGRADYLAHRAPHFLSDNFQPDPWLKLIHLGAPRTREELERLPWSEIAVAGERPDDVDVIADALRAVCLENLLASGSYRVRARIPDRPIRLDLRGCRATAPGGPHDPPELAHHLPPAWCRRVGGDTILVEIHDLGEIPGRAAVLFEKGG